MPGIRLGEDAFALPRQPGEQNGVRASPIGGDEPCPQVAMPGMDHAKKRSAKVASISAAMSAGARLASMTQKRSGAASARAR